MRLTTLLSLFIMLSGCFSVLTDKEQKTYIGLNEDLQVTTSQFDNTKEFSIGPVFTGSDLRLALYRRSDSIKNTSVLKIYTRGINPISSDEDLLINVDGKIIKLKRVPVTSKLNHTPNIGYYPGSTFTVTKFYISLENLNLLTAANKAVVRLNLAGGEYVESTIVGFNSLSGYKTPKEIFKIFTEKAF